MSRAYQLSGQRSLAHEEPLLVFEQGLKGPAGGLLTFKELTVQSCGIFLHLLQDRHAFPGHPERLCNCIARRGETS